MSGDDVAISGNPSPEEVAAIMAAVEMVWPRPSAAAPVARPDGGNWRWSGRWWRAPARRWPIRFG